MNNGMQRKRFDRHKSPGNESCDISPENDRNMERRRAYNGGQTNQNSLAPSGTLALPNGFDEPDHNNISSLNPLVTPGVEMSDRNDNRCSLFNENDARLPRTQAFVVHDGSSTEKASHKRLNLVGRPN